MRETKLYTKDSKGKLRVVIFNVLPAETPGYIIKRYSGLLDGKLTEQPEIVITEGKVKRTPLEQMELELASMIKEKKDKGYKGSIEELSNTKKDAQNRPKPMLAKDPKDQVAKIIKDKTGWTSPKLDGLRMLIGQNETGIFTCSRGGGNYDIPAKLILQDPCIEEFFESYPDALIDGELYCHGVPLEKISGDCRKIEWDEVRHSYLEFWVFDLLIEDMIFEDRLDILNEIIPKTNKIKIVEHIEVNSEPEIMALYKSWVDDGFEGAIWRDSKGTYKCSGRDNRMIKIKLHQDAEFKVIGISEGLRPEDMVFICEMPDGKTFEAKPAATREQRLEYLENFKNYKGKMATIKFFHMSEKGIPNLPIFKTFRSSNDM